jgi:myo-inositol-1(or 4)-monophosphatase
MELEKLCKEIIAILKEVGLYILSERDNFSAKNDVKIKGHSNFVTYVDKTAEKILVSKLGNLIPDSGFIVEEGTSDKKGEIYNLHLIQSVLP